MFRGPGSPTRMLGYVVGGLASIALLVAPLGAQALLPLVTLVFLLSLGMMFEIAFSRGWVLQGDRLVRQTWGEDLRVQGFALQGGPGERLVLLVNGRPMCSAAPENGGLERIEHVGRRMAERAGVPFVDRRPVELWRRWSAGERGLVTLQWRYRQSNREHGLIPGAREPARVAWDHDRCSTSISGIPLEIAGDTVRIGDFRFPVLAFRQAAVLRRRENSVLVARIAFVVDDRVEETPAFSVRSPTHAAQVRWLLERIQERITERGSERDVPARLSRLRSTQES